MADPERAGRIPGRVPPGLLLVMAAIALIPLLAFLVPPIFFPQPRTFTNSIGMKFVWIPPGEFWMGSPEAEEGREPDETRHHGRVYTVSFAAGAGTTVCRAAVPRTATGSPRAFGSTLSGSA